MRCDVISFRSKNFHPKLSKNSLLNIVHLPEDLVVEILTRVPAVSLKRLRSTSKGWNALIKDGRFAKKHSANAPRQSQVIMFMDSRVYLVSINLHIIDNDKAAPSTKVTGQFSLKDPLSNNSSEEVDIRNVFHCDGLLLCTTKSNCRLVVWNLCSGETRWIQPRNSYEKSDSYALGYDNRSSSYKILRMDRFAGDIFQTEYEIFDFTSNLWRFVRVTTHWFIRRYWSCGVSVKGNTYWLACNQYGQGFTLLSFDFSTDIFQSLPLPYSLLYRATALSVVREDQLCLLTHLDDNSLDLHVWVTTKIESNGVMSWNKFLTAKTNSTISPWMCFLADHENKVLVYCNKHGVSNDRFLHILGEDKYIQVDHHNGETKCPFLLTYYVPSLVQIQQGV